MRGHHAILSISFIKYRSAAWNTAGHDTATEEIRI
jgi:hypothetical protein